jgi:hypothetical protein
VKSSSYKLSLLAIAIAAAGVLRDVSVFFWKAGPLQVTRIDDRFAPLLSQLGPKERLGFLTDASGSLAGSRHLDAQYALAPRLVVEGKGEPRIVVDVVDPREIEALCAKWNLRVAARGGAGVALLVRP